MKLIHGMIICDASYNDKLFTAGIAGACSLFNEDNGKSKLLLSSMYQGAAPEIPNSNVAELLAIEAGAKEIRQLIKNGRAPLGTLTIHSDSNVAANSLKSLIEHGTCDPRYEVAAKTALSALKTVIKIDALTFSKVKAHVPHHRANTVERFHNLIDEKARAGRAIFEDHLFKPEKRLPHEKKVVAVVSPSLVSKQDRAHFTSLGRQLALENDQLRILFDTPMPKDHLKETHPLYIGIAQAAAERGRTLDSYLPEQMRNPEASLPCLNGDRILVRNYLYQYKADLLSSRIEKGLKSNPKALEGEQTSKAIHAAVPNVTLKFPLDDIEALYLALHTTPGLNEKSASAIKRGVDKCADLRSKGLSHYNLSAGHCQHLSFIQQKYFANPMLTLPQTFQGDDFSRYYNWATVPTKLIPEPALGYVYHRLLHGNKADPHEYRDPLQIEFHQMRFDKNIIKPAGAVSALLYGEETYSRFNLTTPTGRANPPSERIFNLCTGKYVGQKNGLAHWVERLSPRTSIPYTKGIENALALTKADPTLIPSPSLPSETFGRVSDLLNYSLDSLENHQIRSAMIKILNENNANANNALETVVCTHCHDGNLDHLRNQSDDAKKVDIDSFSHRLVNMAQEAIFQHQNVSPPKEDIYKGRLFIPRETPHPVKP